MKALIIGNIVRKSISLIEFIQLDNEIYKKKRISKSSLHRFKLNQQRNVREIVGEGRVCANRFVCSDLPSLSELFRGNRGINSPGNLK